MKNTIYQRKRRKRMNLWEILLLVGLTSAEREYLLDTSDSTSDLVTGTIDGWQKPSDSMWNDVTSHDEDYNTIRVLQVCNPKARVQKESFIISPFLEHNDSQIVFLEVKYRIRSCATIKSSTCNESFDVLVNMADSISEMSPLDSPEWKQVGRMTGIATRTVEIGPINRKGFFVAFKDFGSCSEVLHTRIYYNYCPSIVSGFAKFDPLATTNVDRKQRGKCIANSQLLFDSSSPEMICSPSGEWKVTGSREKCVCNAGFEPNEAGTDCEPCSPNSYKPKPGSFGCHVCPLNSYSLLGGQQQCACKEGFFRAQSDHYTKPCSEPPSAPESIEYRVNNTELNLWWRKPESDGGRNDLTYRLECQKCGSAFGESCGPCSAAVRIFPKPEDIRPEDRNHAKVTDLEPNTNFIIKVFSVNGVSEIAENHGRNPKYAEIRFQTDSAPARQPVPEIVGSVKVEKSDSQTAQVTWSKSSTPISNYEVKYMDTKGTIFDNIITSSEAYILEELAPSTEYIVQVRAISPAGTGPWSVKEVFRTSNSDEIEIGPYQTDQKGFNWIAVVILSAFLLVALIFIVAFLLIRRNSRNWTKGSRTSFGYHVTSNGPAGTIDASVDLIPCEMKREYIEPRNETFLDFCNELDPTQIQIDLVIAQGDFGDLCRGSYHGQSVQVKTIKSGSNSELMKEAAIMAQFDHPHVIKLEGIVTRLRPNMIVTEYAHNGDLSNFLKEQRPPLVTISRCLADVAAGMQYLHSKRYVHQNLQAKNIFISLDQTAKIGNFCNFGVVDYSTVDKFGNFSTLANQNSALRWTAPEALKTGIHTFSSDIWSFGVLMWESIHFGETPYWGFSDGEVFEAIESGWRLPAPKNAPDNFHQMMLQCWNSDPSLRPFFPLLIGQIETEIQKLAQIPKSVAV